MMNWRGYELNSGTTKEFTWRVWENLRITLFREISVRPRFETLYR
jgi:hypothetical protein